MKKGLRQTEHICGHLCTRRVSEITFPRYVHSQNITKPTMDYNRINCARYGIHRARDILHPLCLSILVITAVSIQRDTVNIATGHFSPLSRSIL